MVVVVEVVVVVVVVVVLVVVVVVVVVRLVVAGTVTAEWKFFQNPDNMLCRLTRLVAKINVPCCTN